MAEEVNLGEGEEIGRETKSEVEEEMRNPAMTEEEDNGQME